MWKRRRLDVGISVPLHALRIGMPVHLKGTDFGCVWIIVSIALPDSKGQVWLTVRTPQTGVISRANATRARYTRAQEPNYRRF